MTYMPRASSDPFLLQRLQKEVSPTHLSKPQQQSGAALFFRRRVHLVSGWYHQKLALAHSSAVVADIGSAKQRKVSALDRMVGNMNLKIVEKNMSQSGAKKKSPRKLKRPHKQLQHTPCAEQNQDMEEEELTMTDMERLFRLAEQEKRKVTTQDKNDDDDVEMADVDVKTNEQGRQVKVNGSAAVSTTADQEAQARSESESRVRSEFGALSANAQLLGHYIGWGSQATTDFVMGREAAYLQWKKLATEHYQDMYNNPRFLKQRHDSLLRHVSKYAQGLLRKFGVDATQTTNVCRQMRLLVETLDISKAIPAFTPKTWCFVALVFLKLLSHRIVQLKSQMFDKQTQVRKVLATIGYGEEYVTTLEQVVVL